MTCHGAPIVAVLACLFASTAAHAGPVTSFDDVVYWTGAGANHAAVVIDFIDSSDDDPALTWGYRWDGQVTGRQMLDAVLAADARLYGKIGNQPSVFNAILALGYDRNDDGQFAVSSGESFNSGGIAFGEPIERPAVTPVGGDWYREGWEEVGFWHYGVTNVNPWTGGVWSASQEGASQRLLVNGSWDCWAFSTEADDHNVYDLVFARNPVAATPPGGHADFDGDHDVDGADLLAWQRGFGADVTASSIDGDANGDGDADADDFAAWTAAFGNPTTAHAVPEPPAGALILGLLVILGSLTLLWRNVS